MACTRTKAYGEFYNDMAGKGHSSWLDYLMDRVSW